MAASQPPWTTREIHGLIWLHQFCRYLQIHLTSFNIIYLITSRKQPGTPMDFPWWSRHLQPIAGGHGGAECLSSPGSEQQHQDGGPWYWDAIGHHWTPDTEVDGDLGKWPMNSHDEHWWHMMKIDEHWNKRERTWYEIWWTRFSIKRNVNWLARHGPSWSPFNAYQVGIEDCLHIEFEPLGASFWVHVPSPFPMVHEAWDGRLELRYDKSKYHMKDVIIGKATADISW